MAAACFYHLRHLRRRVEVTTRLVVALVISRLDCCRASTLYNRTAPTRSERRCSTGIQTQSVRGHTKPTPVTLTTHTLARPVQTMLLYARSWQLSPDAVQRMWGAPCNQPHSRVPVCDRHLSTSLYHGQGPSSASGLSLTPARLCGTHCRAMSAKQSIPLALGSC